MKKIVEYVAVGICGLAVSIGAWWIHAAEAHSGSASMTTFSSGQVLTSNALNANFQHLHDTLSGGIANINISNTAAISHSKLAVPALVPKAWAVVPTTCAGACVIGESSNVTAINRTGTGTYTVTLAYTPVNSTFGVLVTCRLGTRAFGYVTATAFGIPQITFVCDTGAGPVDAAFSILVMDS